MFDRETRLHNLEGLSIDDKIKVEGKLLVFDDDDKAARFFKHNESDMDTVRRLRALLPYAGETRKLTVISAQQLDPASICNINMVPTGSSSPKVCPRLFLVCSSWILAYS